MVDEVISGGQQIASEATLQRLVDLMAGGGDQGSAAKLKDLAGKAGVATEAITTTGGKMKALIPGLIGFGEGLINGTGSASQLASMFTVLGGNIGLAAAILAKLISIQEQNFKEYQNITSAGANFGGSLTDLRLAAMNSYLTLEQFGKIIKENSRTLSAMGGSVNDGAKAFAGMSKQLISNEMGAKLMALGYTTEELNDGMLKYIGTTGGRTKEELKNTAAITEATSNYLVELDRVTQFTGANRKQMEEEQKKAAAQAAFQRKMQSLGEAERAKLQAAYDKAAASGIQGATDAVMSAALGMPPLTKEAQQFAGTLPDAYNGLTEMTNTAMKTSSSMDDVNHASGKFYLGAVKGAEQLGKAGDALSLQGNAVITGAIGLQNQMNAKGVKTMSDFDKSQKDISNNQSIQAKSQANAMASVQRTLQELGALIMKALTPALMLITPVLGWLFDGISLLLKPVGLLMDGLDTLLNYAIRPFVKVFDEVTSGVKFLLGQLSKMLEPVIAPFAKLFSTGNGNLGKFFTLIGDVIALPIKGIFLGLGWVIENVLTPIFKGLGVVIGVIITPFQAFADIISKAFDFLTEILEKASNFLNPSSWFGGSDKKPQKKMAEGGIVTKATSILAGESGTEAVLPLTKFDGMMKSILGLDDIKATKGTQNSMAELSGNTNNMAGTESLKQGLDQLNTSVQEMIRGVRDVAEYTRRTFEATKSLSGDHFA